MQPSNLDAIRKSFGAQAQSFETSAMNFSKEEYLAYTVSRAEPSPTDCVLEVAAGTCACGRALAPLAQTVACLDATPAMLEVGKREAGAKGIRNMIFVKGCAEELPFLDDSFDIVISRLAFHHFPEVERPFREMVRALKPGGKLVLIDMEAAEESLRATEDGIETLRDPSHVKNLSQAELLGLFEGCALNVERCEKAEMPTALRAWMELTGTPGGVREEIVRRMETELDGGGKTGFSPYRKDGGIYYNQRWILIIGRKPSQDP